MARDTARDAQAASIEEVASARPGDDEERADELRDDDEPRDQDERRDDGEDDSDEAGDLDFAASTDTVVTGESRGAGGWLVALGVTMLVALAFAIGLRRERADSMLAFALLGTVYTGLSVIAVLRLRARRETRLLRPRAGDVTIGAFVAAILYGLALASHLAITSKPPAVGWVFQIYLLFGDPLSNVHLLVSAALGVIGALEELTWRGLVLPVLEERMGTSRASVTTAILYASAHLPTMFLLADPVAGRNPLLVIAALGCGLVWSYLRFRTERLVPVLLAHGLFTWAIVEFPLWRP